MYVIECLQLEHFQTDGNFQKLNLYIEKVTKHLLLITGQFHYFPFFKKIFEKIICKRLYHHLSLKNILVKEQFGFRSNNSNEKATNFLDMWIYGTQIKYQYQ
jgi:hypothetical protein